MAKITISSSRVYYNELDINDAFSICSDICTYQSMLHKSYKELYCGEFIDPKYLKNIYHTNDYFPLSAIPEAKGLLSSQTTWHEKSIRDLEKRITKTEKKIKKEEKKLAKYLKTQESLIKLSKAIKSSKRIPSVKTFKGFEWNKDNYNECVYDGKTMLLYLFEVQILKPMIKRTRTRIKLLRNKVERLTGKLTAKKLDMKQIHFHKRNYMKITGRSQGKYCNNLFKYDHISNEMTYIDTHQRRIVFPLYFPYRGEELVRVLNLPHATKGKSVCYTLIDKGEYFIIHASIELDIHIDDYVFDKSYGVVGIDINDEHVALSETDKHGNLIRCEDIPLLLKNKSSNQRKWIIEDTVKNIMNYCQYVHKPLIIEKLNFEQKKKDFRIYNQNKKYNRMLSEFSYRIITEKIYSRAYKDGIGVMEVNPAYTSLIGKLKYATQKGISIHKAASFVIARRGMGYKERLPQRLYDNINEKSYTRWRNYNKLAINQ